MDPADSLDSAEPSDSDALLDSVGSPPLLERLLVEALLVEVQREPLHSLPTTWLQHWNWIVGNTSSDESSDSVASLGPVGSPD